MKKGFTLVELLIVIALIGLLTAIAVPSAITISKKVKAKMLDAKIELIESAGIVYGQRNESKLLSKDSTNCSIEGILNDSEVTNCVSVKITDLLNKDLLEEDKIVDGNKVLINPVSDKPLNDCSVEVYLKNKRVYAEYNIDATNCGYEVTEDDDEEVALCETYPCIVLKNNTAEGNVAILNSSEDLFEKYVNGESDSVILIKIKNAEYNNWEEPGYEIIGEGNEVIADENDNVCDITRSNYSTITPSNSKIVGSWTYTYKIKDLDEIEDSEIVSKIQGKEVNSVTRTVYLKDSSAPLLIDYNSDREYVGDDIYLFRSEGATNWLSLRDKYYLFDNYEGLLLYSDAIDWESMETISLNYEIDAVNKENKEAKDNSNNKRTYELNFYYHVNSLPGASYGGETYFYDSVDIVYFNDAINVHDVDSEYNGPDGVSMWYQLVDKDGNLFTDGILYVGEYELQIYLSDGIMREVGKPEFLALTENITVVSSYVDDPSWKQTGECDSASCEWMSPSGNIYDLPIDNPSDYFEDIEKSESGAI